MNWLLVLSYNIWCLVVLWCIALCFSIAKFDSQLLNSLMLCNYARFAFLPELSISQDYMGKFGDGFWDPSQQGCQRCSLSSNSMTLLHIQLGCRYLFPEWCLHSLHFRTAFILMICFFFCIGHWMSLVIGLLTTSWQDLKDRADSFRSMQSEARKRHV